MKDQNFPTQNSKAIGLSTVLLLVASICSPLTSQAVNHVLYDNGSTAQVDVDSSIGMHWWDVDGVNNQLQKQWFYYRIGGGIAQPINNISAASVDYNTGNSLGVTYTSIGSFSLSVEYTLNGGGIGSGNGDILETISVINLGATSLDFHLFQYSNFDLLGSPNNDSVSIASTGTGYDSAVHWEGSYGISEGIVSPEASRAEAALAFNTEISLTTIAGYNLNNNLTLLNGDVTWAFQWDNEIAVNDGLFIFKDKSMSIAPIPEPSAMALLAVGVAAIGLRIRRSTK